MSEEQDEFKKKLESLKPKKKIDVAEGLLDNAKSYEGKVLAIQIIADRELKRTVLLFKKLLEPEPIKQKESPKSVPVAPAPKKKSFLGKK
jgi:hypothetical protein